VKSLKTVKVNASKSYDILIGRNILKNTGKLTAEVKTPCKAAVICDDIVDSLYSECVVDSLKESGFDVIKFVFPNSEISKTTSTFINILEFLAENNLTRSDLVVALGGGVTGDIAGFAASAYLRGIDFIQIPTTFLAAVDSSVGGKTGVNLNAGKNLAGAFHQPIRVICDCDTFKTLSPKIVSDGAAEVIKYGIICDRGLLEILKNENLEENFEKIVERCVKIKSDIVHDDEFDKGRRQLLNFGHTVGHAIEKCSNYEITHGDAVAAGMSIISAAADKMNFSEESCLEILSALLKKFNLPEATSFSAEMLAEAALSDKKRSGSKITLVMPKSAGDCVLQTYPTDELEKIFALGIGEIDG
jgi:3-dehydroquinate synthase